MEIPQNAGTLARLCACLGVQFHLIGPLGFLLSDRLFKRAGMDYLDRVALCAYDDWKDFREKGPRGRLISLCAKEGVPYTQFLFQSTDTLLLGAESCGLPAHAREASDALLTIPMAPGARSLNVALCGAMVLGEALRQTRGGTV